MTATKRKDKRVGSVSGKDTKIQIRAKPADRLLIDSAAEIQGKNRTEFMMESSLNQAQKDLLEQTIFRLKPAAWDKLMEILDAPAERNPKLERLMKQPAPWER